MKVAEIKNNPFIFIFLILILVFLIGNIPIKENIGFYEFIIVSPPVGMAAAILTVLGLNITTMGMAFGLGQLCGVW